LLEEEATAIVERNAGLPVEEEDNYQDYLFAEMLS